MIELTSSAPVPAEVRWTVNGRPLAEFAPPRADGRSFLPLARGEWRIEAAPATAGDERHPTAAVRVTVE